jgi:HK97 gp10 family phage protein
MLQRAREGLSNAITEGLTNAAELVQGAAQTYAPVRTGYLRSSISYNVSGMVATIIASASYAPYVEFGHAVRSGWKVKGPVVGHVPPHPFMRPALYSSIDGIQSALSDAVMQVFE